MYQAKEDSKNYYQYSMRWCKADSIKVWGKLRLSIDVVSLLKIQKSIREITKKLTEDEPENQCVKSITILVDKI